MRDPFLSHQEAIQNEAETRLARVFEVAGCRTQLELAAVLDIRQSSISDAKRRGAIPSDWLIRLLQLRAVNPEWVMNGTGPKFLAPSNDPDDANYPYESFPPVRAVDAAIVRNILSCFPARDLEGELQRRRESSPRNSSERKDEK